MVTFGLWLERAPGKANGYVSASVTYVTYRRDACTCEPRGVSNITAPVFVVFAAAAATDRRDLAGTIVSSDACRRM